MEMDKTSEVNPSSHNETQNNSELLEKKVTSASLVPASSHGMKLALNMSLHDKKELLLRLEEWRKTKRENLCKSNSTETKNTQKTASRSALPVKVGQNKLGNKKLVCATPNERESVFERLYQNSRTSKIKVKTSRSDSENDNASVKSGVTIAKKSKDFKSNNKELKSVCDVNAKILKDVAPLIRKEKIDIEERMQKVADFISSSHFDQDEKQEVSLMKHNSIGGDTHVLENEMSSEKMKSKMIIPEGSENKENENGLDLIMEKSSVEEKPKVNEVASKPMKKFFLPKSDLVGKSNNSNGTKHGESRVEVNSSKKALPKVPVRRSISMLYRKKLGMSRASSEKDLHQLKSPPNEKERKIPSESFTYEDALDKKKRRMFLHKTRLLFSPIKGSNSSTLRDKLEDWLKINGHSLDGYRHLRCFGISNGARKSQPDASKKNSESRRNISAVPDPSEYSLPPEESAEKSADADLPRCENWLKELYELIVKLEYPTERCEEWLMAIRKKCPESIEFPIYWECLAALGGTDENMESALDHYEEATTKETEMETAGNILSELFDKMMIENQKPAESKLEKGINPKNIFKSTIIKFALQEKSGKESDGKSEEGSAEKPGQFVATPVRRSSRIHTPCKTNTVNSLRSLTPDVRKKITFKANKSLLNMV